MRIIIPFTLSFLFVIAGFGQDFKTIPIIKSLEVASARTPCVDRPLPLGNISLALGGQSQSNSNPATDRPIFLCLGDNLTATGVGAGVTLGGDPNPATDDFVGFTIYDCKPTIDGPNIDSILTFDCPYNATSAQNINLAFDFDDPGSETVIFNNIRRQSDGQTLTEIINGGQPFEWWYAPITIDDADDKFEGVPIGSCVTVDTGQAFSIVYLNPVNVGNLIIPFPVGGDSSQARIQVFGGLPEWDNTTNYSVDVTNVTNGVKGDVNLTNIRPGDTPVITVPEKGDYRITITDGISCDTSFVLAMGTENQQDASLTITSTGGTVEVGDEICVNFQIEGFENLTNGQFLITWDTSLLEIQDGVTNPADGNWAIAASVNNNTRGGRIPVSWVSTDITSGSTFQPEDTLFTLCFIAKAEGDATIFLQPDGFTPDEFNDADGTQITNIDKSEGVINIIDPDKVTSLVGEKKDACPTTDNGSVSINIFGGAPPYEISIDGPILDGPRQITSADDPILFENLPAGLYTVLVRDLNSNDFSNNTTFEIFTANLGVTLEEDAPITCNGFSDGILRANVTLEGVAIPDEDLATYTFEWSDGNGDMISDEVTAENLAWGNYSVEVTSNNGCSQSASGSLSQPGPIQPMININRQPTCSGSTDGEIEITNIDGGRPDFDIQWSNGTNGLINQNVEEGKYIYTIIDAGGCVRIDSTTLTAGLTIVTNPIVDPITCFDVNNGQITVNASANGSVNLIPSNPNNYQFNWSDNAPIDMESGVRSLLSDLAEGDYTVTITHPELPAQCMAVETFSIVNPPELIVNRVDITPTSSCQIEDGEINVSVIGGTIANNYQYAWSDTNSMTVRVYPDTNFVADLASGQISLAVNDDNGCTTMIDTVVGTPPPPSVQFFDDQDLLCADDDTDLQIIAVPGRPNVDIVDYQWSHDASITGPNATNVGPDTFIVIIIDADRCATVDTAIVSSPAPIQTRGISSTEPCFQAEDGILSLNGIQGGTPNAIGDAYSFEWKAVGNSDVLNNSSTLTGVMAGDYILSVIDANDCSFDTTITLGNIPRIEVAFDLASVTGVDCFDTVDPNDCTGSVNVNAEYENNGGGLFTFEWLSTNEASNPTNAFTSNSLCAGFQLLSITDGQCIVIDSVEIPSPPRLEFDVANSSITPATCFNDIDGQAIVAAIGGTPGYQFTWPDGGNELTKSGLAANSYELTITDANNCITVHDVVISQPDSPLSVTIDPDNTNDIICEGGIDDGMITVQITGGNEGQVSYQWTNNVSNGNSAAGLAAGPYNVLVTDAKGCTHDVNYTVAQPSPIMAEVEWDPIQCNGFQTGIRLINPTGGNGNDYTFSIDNSPAREFGETISEFGGDRLVSVFDATGCREDFNVTIPQPRPLEAFFTDNATAVEVDLGSSIDLNLTISGDAPISDIFWTQGGEDIGADSVFVCSINPCTNPTVNPIDNTQFTAFVSDANGCMTEASILVDVDKNRNVYIPNVFAPNNAGFDTNDRFEVFTGSGVTKINSAKVFNRWGTLVADINERRINGTGDVVLVWDGFLRGEKANQGVYIYIIEVEFIDGEKLLYRGDVALLR